MRFCASNGCQKSNKFVYLPTDKRRSSPYVMADGQVYGPSRLHEDGQRKEAVDGEQFYKHLRRLQKETNCTEKTVLKFVSTFEKFSKCPVQHSLRAADRKMQVCQPKI